MVYEVSILGVRTIGPWTFCNLDMYSGAKCHVSRFSFFQIVPFTEFISGTHWSPQLSIRADQVGSSGAFGAIPLFTGIFIDFVIHKLQICLFHSTEMQVHNALNASFKLIQQEKIQVRIIVEAHAA